MSTALVPSRPSAFTARGPAPTEQIPQVTHEPSLDELAAEIKHEHTAAERSVRDSVAHARAAGEKLLEVKNRLPHGQFIPWVEEHCAFKYATAALYMKVAREWAALPSNSNGVRNLSLREAARLLYGEEEQPAAYRAPQPLKSPRPRSGPRRKNLPPFEEWVDLARKFIRLSRTLLTEPYGLLEKYVVLSDEQRQQLVKLVADARRALGELETEAAAITKD